MIKCVVIDKDKKSREETEKCIAQFAHLDLVKSAATVADAAEAIKENKVDIIFLSTPPEIGKSLDFLKFMKYEKPDLVMMGGEKAQAREAFDHDAADFILKPVTVERIAKSLTKVSKTLEEDDVLLHSTVLFVRDKRHYVKVNLKDLYLVEALSDYVNIYVTGGKRYTVHATMKSMLNKLPETEFVRIHNSYIVRIDKIKEITKDTVEVEDRELPVSHTYKKGMMQRLKLAE
jgi:DNA-binding LytR/AlgR family response regulator